MFPDSCWYCWGVLCSSSSNPSSMRLVKLRWGVVFLGTTLCTYSRLGVFELENQSLTPLTKLPINSTVFSPRLFFIRASQSVPHKVRERGVPHFHLPRHPSETDFHCLEYSV